MCAIKNLKARVGGGMCIRNGKYFHSFNTANSIKIIFARTIDGERAKKKLRQRKQYRASNIWAHFQYLIIF